jgi:hypothetical protein
LVFTVGVALELLAPSIKENNGDSALNPLLVRDTLTIVVPDNTALLPNHAISVTWTGADGTPAGGSHTSAPRAVSEGLEFAIPNSVVAFNLGKRVKVSYVVIIDGHPTPSRVFDLTVQAMPQSALASPTIEQADNDGAGPELHTGNLTQASVRMGDWPLIALNQYVWLRLCGTNTDGSAYVREIWSAPTAFTTPDWIADRFFTVSLPADELKALQDGSGLELVFKAALGQSTVESEAVEFPVRTYTIKSTSVILSHALYTQRLDGTDRQQHTSGATLSFEAYRDKTISIVTTFSKSIRRVNFILMRGAGGPNNTYSFIWRPVTAGKPLTVGPTDHPAVRINSRNIYTFVVYPDGNPTEVYGTFELRFV